MMRTASPSMKAKANRIRNEVFRAKAKIEKLRERLDKLAAAVPAD